MVDVLTNEQVGKALAQALINLVNTPEDLKARWTVAVYIDIALKAAIDCNPIDSRIPAVITATQVLKELPNRIKDHLLDAAIALLDENIRVVVLAEAIFSPDKELAYLSRVMRAKRALKGQFGGLNIFKETEERIWVTLREAMERAAEPRPASTERPYTWGSDQTEVEAEVPASDEDFVLEHFIDLNSGEKDMDVTTESIEDDDGERQEKS